MGSSSAERMMQPARQPHALDEGGAVVRERPRRPGQHFGGRHPLGLGRAERAREHCPGNRRRGHAQVQRDLAGPLARALLLDGVQDHLHQRAAGLLVSARQDVRREVDQVTRQLAAVPFGEHGGHLGRGQRRQRTQQRIGFADELHVGVFDAVVHHLQEVARAAGAAQGALLAVDQHIAR
jgi:hypothetical protein